MTQEQSKMKTIMATLLIGSLLAACNDTPGQEYRDLDCGTGGDADSDADTDTDADGDTDADSDSDTDSDGDTDVDSDSDADKEGGCLEGGEGSLTVNIVLPDSPEVIAEVRLLGPDGFEATSVKESITLPHVPTGEYRGLVMAYADRSEDAGHIGKAYGELETCVKLVCVEDSETATMEVEYSVQPGSGMAWVVGEGQSYLDVIAGFDQEKVAVPAAVDPDTWMGNDDSNYNDLAFDRMGNLWVTSHSHVDVFSPAQLGESGTNVDAFAVLNSSCLDAARGLAFDPQGNMWVSNWHNGNHCGYMPKTLAAVLSQGGKVTVDADRTVAVAGYERSEYTSFDSDGNLWASMENTADNEDHYVKIAAADLAASGYVQPEVDVLPHSDQDFSIIGGNGACIDKDGNLWGTSISGFFKVDHQHLQVSGDPIVSVLESNSVTEVYGDVVSGPEGNIWFAQTKNIVRHVPGEESFPEWLSSPVIENPISIAFYPLPIGTPVF